ncbi:hypothetical protein ACFS4T_19575 [Pseudomonas lini]
MAARLAEDADACPPLPHDSLFRALTSARVLLLGLANFAIVVGAYGVSFFSFPGSSRNLALAICRPD